MNEHFEKWWFDKIGESDSPGEKARSFLAEAYIAGQTSGFRVGIETAAGICRENKLKTLAGIIEGYIHNKTLFSARKAVIDRLKESGIDRDIWVFGCDDCSCTFEMCEWRYDPINLDGNCHDDACKKEDA